MTDKQPAAPAPVGAVPYEVYRQEQELASRREAAELNMDETVEGGRYQVGDQVVDAEGRPLKKADQK